MSALKKSLKSFKSKLKKKKEQKKYAILLKVKKYDCKVQDTLF